jgi:hypothetical protein
MTCPPLKEGEVVEGYPLKTQINQNKERLQREKNPPGALDIGTLW